MTLITYFLTYGSIELFDVMPVTVIVRYGEIALKSGPVRRRFELALIESMKRVLIGLKYNIRFERGRIFVDTNSPATVIKRLAKVPGIISLSPSASTKANMHNIRTQTIKAAKKSLRAGMSFAVRTKRVGDHPFSSMDVNVKIGALILSKIKNMRVDLSDPDAEISIDIRGEDAYIYTKTVKGVGGLPIGTQGKVVTIFSGAWKEAAATFMMLKRGCKLVLLYLDPGGKGNSIKTRRVIFAAKKLAEFDPTIKLWSIPFKEILIATGKKSVKRSAFYIFRRSALRASEILANRVRAEALVVDDDAKQLVKQRLLNTRMIDEASKLAVLRPLSGMGKKEIKQMAEKTGIKFHAGIRPYLSSSEEILILKNIRKLEEKINIYRIIEEASTKIRKMKIR